MKVLVSACLLGRNCKYSGGNNYNPGVAEYLKDKEVIEVCPEVLAGLGIPRIPIEIAGGQLRDRNGVNVDPQLREAVAQILEQVAGEDIACAVLQSRSPTCGKKGAPCGAPKMSTAKKADCHTSVRTGSQ